MVENPVLVNITDIRVARDPATLSCLGLGSCIGLCAFDPLTGIGGMVHLMLPGTGINTPTDQPGKFVDTGIPKLIELMESEGAKRSRLLVAYAGGAQIFKGSLSTFMEGFSVGTRNQLAVEQCIAQLNLNCIARDVGGHSSRNLVLFTQTAEVRISSSASGGKVLCVLDPAKNSRKRQEEEIIYNISNG